MVAGRKALGGAGRPLRRALGRAAGVVGLVLAVSAVGCTTTGAGVHREVKVHLGLELFGVKLISVGDFGYGEVSPACLERGARLSGTSASAPVSLLGLGEGVHLLRAGPAPADLEAMQRAQQPAPTAPAAIPPTLPEPNTAPPDTESDPHRPDDRSRHD